MLTRDGNGVWSFKGIVPGTQSVVLSIVSTDDGSLWLGTAASGVMRLRYDPGVEELLNAFEVEHYGSEQGVPEGWVTLSMIENRLLLSAKSGLFSFERSSEKWG